MSESKLPHNSQYLMLLDLWEGVDSLELDTLDCPFSCNYSDWKEVTPAKGIGGMRCTDQQISCTASVPVIIFVTSICTEYGT